MTEAAQNMVTVAEAKQLPDETAVTLSGLIVRKTHKDHFELKDSSGKIGIEVDANTGQVTDIDVVQIGKIDNQSGKWTWYNQQ